MLFVDVARAVEAVAATSKRNEKVALLAALVGAASPDEVAAVVALAIGTTRHGRIGVGWATMHDVQPAPASEATLTVLDVEHAIGELGAISGDGSVARRRERLGELLARATPSEQRLVRAVVGGELRQGALDGVMAAAVAKATGVKVAQIRRAAMFAGSLPIAARIAAVAGSDALANVSLTPSVPVQPMLASPAPDVATAIAEVGRASVEWKLDGARIQAHRCGDDVRIFTRNLNDVTERLTGVVDVVRGLPGGDLVLDGEVIGVDDEGSARPFQDTMGDFGADLDASGIARGATLTPFFFDVLLADVPLVDEPLAERRRLLAELVPSAHRLRSIVTDDADLATAFFDDAVAAGHEGAMVKAIDSTYEAGRRGGSWRKVKPVHTFDLVVLAAEWGHGRRRGWLSNLHLGARAADGSFVMVGKTFKGLTDELLRWQTERFLDLETGRGSGRESNVVEVRPEQVVEVAVDGVQRSTRYSGGVALRFARVRRYRHDKAAPEADTIDTIRSLLR